MPRMRISGSTLRAWAWCSSSPCLRGGAHGDIYLDRGYLILDMVPGCLAGAEPGSWFRSRGGFGSVQ